MRHRSLSQFTSPRNSPERDLFSASVAIQQRLPFSRSLTKTERLAVAVSGCAPSHFLTIDSATQDRLAFMAAWRRVIKRLERMPKRGRPLIYVGTVARSLSEDGGYHFHALLWEFLYVPLLITHCREARLGYPQIRMLPSPTVNYTQVLAATSYVLGQHERVFGSGHHKRHRPLPRYARAHLHPQRTTLALHHPNLLAALDKARDRSVTDSSLVSQVPVFTRSRSLGSSRSDPVAR